MALRRRLPLPKGEMWRCATGCPSGVAPRALSMRAGSGPGENRAEEAPVEGPCPQRPPQRWG
eukprot:15006183-Alexandrium_andersonii.AAC.1